MNLPNRFILVDDDPINNLIIEHQIKTKISTEIEIVSFESPIEGLSYIMNYDGAKSRVQTVLFLDLNMPVFSGWDFLEKLEKLDDQITNQLTIYVSSSSLDNRDIERANNIDLVKDYLIKPLTADILVGLFN